MPRVLQFHRGAAPGGGVALDDTVGEFFGKVVHVNLNRLGVLRGIGENFKRRMRIDRMIGKDGEEGVREGVKEAEEE